MRNKFKGWIGELKLRLAMWVFLSKKYRILNDITILLPQGKTSQIDHVLVSPYGIFVIETKNYQGLITANEEDGMWLQGFSRNNYRFYSPIRQNEGHIRSLKYLLKSHEYPMMNIVGFVGKADFNGAIPTGVANGAIATVRLIKRYKAAFIKPDEVTRIYELIEARRMPSNMRTKRLHIRNVRAKQG